MNIQSEEKNSQYTITYYSSNLGHNFDFSNPEILVDKDLYLEKKLLKFYSLNFQWIIIIIIPSLALPSAV